MKSVIVTAAMVAVVCGLFAGEAAKRRVWRVEPDITIEETAADFKAWSGPDPGTPLFSVSALMAAEKKKFDEHALELARGLENIDPEDRVRTGDGPMPYDHAITIEVLSVVGPLITYRESGGGYAPGAAHPSGYRLLRFVDVSRKEAQPTLLDYFTEKQLVETLKADPWLRKFAAPDGGFTNAESLEELVDALDAEWARENAGPEDEESDECEYDAWFGRDTFVQQFYFHHLERGQVAVHIEVGPGSEWCNRRSETHTIALLLPIPATLREPLRRAHKGKAGFLAASRDGRGAIQYSRDWQVDIATLIKR